MAGSMNKAMLLGNVGKDPEIRSMNSGDRVASFSIATSETWKDKQTGEKKERTQWHNVVVWGGLVEIVDKYVRKGSKVMVEGSIETRSWDKEGEKRYTTEIVLRPYNGDLYLLGDPQGQRSGGERRDESAGGGYGYDGGRGAQDQRGNFSADLDDEIPF